MIRMSIARGLLDAAEYEAIELAVEALSRLEVRGAISRAFLDRMIALIAEEVASEALARAIARA